MMANFMHEHMGDDVAERVVALGPEVEDGSPIKPDHVRLCACLGKMLALGEAATAKKAKKIEFGFARHLVERLLVREVLDVKHDPLAQTSERCRQRGESRVGERLDFHKRRGAYPRPVE